MSSTKMPAQKIIAFDLDGTLTVSKTAITKEMALLVKDLMKDKIVVIISGGSFKLISETQFLPTFLSLPGAFDFINNLKIITTSGTQRYEYSIAHQAWDLVDRTGIDEEVKNRVKKLFKEIIDNPIYEIPKNPIGEIVEDRDTQITFTPNGQLAPVEIKKLFDPDRKKRGRIVSEIGPKLPEVDLLINGVSSIDVVPKGCNKGFGLCRFLESAGFQKTDMLFFGDAIFPGGNDYSVYEAGIETISVKGPEETSAILKDWVS